MMRYYLNLAQRPFVNIALPTILALLAAAAIIAFTAANVLVLLSTPAAEGGFDQRIEDALANLERMQTEITATEKQLSSEEADLLGARIKFANELIARQKLNWTRLFDRLEAITPTTVRMLQISPYSEGGRLALLLRIEESEPEAALALVKALSDSPHFGQVSLEDETPSNAATGKIWRLRVSYMNR